VATAKTIKRLYRTESRLKTALFYALELLVDVLIIYVIVKGFSLAYSFSYEVFSDSAKNDGDTRPVIVTILPDSSIKTVSESLYDAGVIKNKYVMMVKIRLNGYGPSIRPGRYAINPSMTYNEIITLITTDPEQETTGKLHDGFFYRKT